MSFGLVVSRQVDEQVVIVVPPSESETRIVFTLVDLRGPKARCGFAAPPTVTVNRFEIQHQIDSGIVAGRSAAAREGK